MKIETVFNYDGLCRLHIIETENTTMIQHIRGMYPNIKIPKVAIPEVERYMKEHEKKEIEIEITSDIPLEMESEIIKRSKEYFIKSGAALDIGKQGILIRDYGKYSPNLCFIVNDNEILNTFNVEEREGKLKISDYIWDKAKSEDLNIMNIEFSGELDRKLIGNYRKNKKGTNIFEVNKNGKHILFRIGWGGSFNTSDGINYTKDSIYYRRARSNGGGVGNDYIIFNRDHKRQLDIEEI